MPDATVYLFLSAEDARTAMKDCVSNYYDVKDIEIVNFPEELPHYRKDTMVNLGINLLKHAPTPFQAYDQKIREKIRKTIQTEGVKPKEKEEAPEKGKTGKEEEPEKGKIGERKK